MVYQVASEVVWLFKTPTKTFAQERSSIHRLYSVGASAEKRLLTLETTTKILGQASKYEELLTLKKFQGHIIPDLPLIDSFSDLIKLKWIRKESSRSVEDPSHSQDPYQGKYLRIETVAAQARSRRQLTKIIKDKGNRSDVLLCVSGSSFLRKVPLAKRMLPNCLWLLDETTRLKAQGHLPKGLKLWVVANPNKDSNLDYLKSKIHHGAETIITQPPLDANRFDQWWAMIQKSNIQETVRIMIGIPMISSMSIFNFWCRLCEIRARRGITPSPPEYTSPFWEQWNEAFILKFASIHGIGGFHFMPLTNNGRRMTVELLQRHPELDIFL